MLDSLDIAKTCSISVGGFWVSLWEILPDMVRLGVGVATLIYLIMKIKKMNG